MEDYRIVTLIQKDPPDAVRRHAQMMPGKTGRYGKSVTYRHDTNKTLYEVLYFKAGRPPTREEVLADLRADLLRIETRMKESKDGGPVSGLINRVMFNEQSGSDLAREATDLRETISIVEEDYEPGEAVPIP